MIRVYIFLEANIGFGSTKWQETLISPSQFSSCSRDTILHIEGKEELFRKLLKTLKPGGRLLITDYCRGEKVFTVLKAILQETRRGRPC